MQQRPPRYEIQKPVAYRLKTPDGPLEGSGTTVNISRRGILFASDRELTLGKRIELIVDMGDQMGSPTEMHIQGVTLRNQNGSVAVQIKKCKLTPVDSA